MTTAHRIGMSLLAALLIAAPADAQQAPASPADTDPAKLGWMQGSPPPPDKRVTFADGTVRQGRTFAGPSRISASLPRPRACRAGAVRLPNSP